MMTKQIKGFSWIKAKDVGNLTAVTSSATSARGYVLNTIKIQNFKCVFKDLELKLPMLASV